MKQNEKQIEKRINTLEQMLSEVLHILKDKNFLTIKVNDCKYSFYEWLDEWFNTYKVPKLKKGSITEISVCIRNHIKPNIVNKPLNKISGLEIQKALNQIQTSRTKKYTFNVLNGAFKQAVKLKLINENVMNSVDSVKHKYKNGNALTKEQQVNFYKAIEGNKYKELYLFYIYSGCRKSEATNLKWEDIDFKNKLIYIKGTKTEYSNRVIPLFPLIEELFNSLKRNNENVFNCSANAISCNFKRLKREYKFSFRLHDLRHTFATRCLQNGISMKTIQKWLGHSRFETTSNIYAHIQSSFEYEEILKYNPNI